MNKIKLSLKGREINLKTKFYVMTPAGFGEVWGIDNGKVLVEMDYRYLVEFDLKNVEGIDKNDKYFF